MWSSDRRNEVRGQSVGRTEIDEENLVFGGLNRGTKVQEEGLLLTGRKIAAEHRELNVLAAALHDLEDAAQALRVADIVRDVEAMGHRVRKVG